MNATNETELPNESNARVLKNSPTAQRLATYLSNRGHQFELDTTNPGLVVFNITGRERTPAEDQ